MLIRYGLYVSNKTREDRNTVLHSEAVANPTGATATAAFVVGGFLIIWLSYIHFHLWQSVGDRHIPTTGALFLVQSIAGLVLGPLVIAVRRVWAAALDAGFAVATMVGFLVWWRTVYSGSRTLGRPPMLHR
jgi:hypothetical protein